MEPSHLSFHLRGLKISECVTCAREKKISFSVTETGSFLVRYDIRPEILIENLRKFSEEAKERKLFYQQLKRRRKFLEERLCETYGIKEIRKQPGLPNSKMVDCLQRLLRSKIFDNYPMIGTGDLRFLFFKNRIKHPIISWESSSHIKELQKTL